MSNQEKTVALLVDSENISPDYFTDILAKAKKRGNVTYCRIFGDFTSAQATEWRKIVHDHGAEAVQQFPFTSGKNATDSRMIIDAMDILYTGRADIFCLATSDSDFTNLAVRLRHDNIVVIGLGEEKAPPAFRNACSEFVVVGKKRGAEKAAPKSAPKAAPEKVTEKTRQGDNTNKQAASGSKMDKLLADARAILARGNWMQFSVFIEALRKTYPKFDPRHFGAPKKDKVAFFKGLGQGGPVFDMKKTDHVDYIRLFPQA